VDSCLPQEEYRELYPNGESESPYVFVCTKPEQLNILLPVHGDHKICEQFYVLFLTICVLIFQ